MTPRAGVAARREAQRRARERTVARRRHSLLRLGALALVAIAAVVLVPVFLRALTEFTLPLSYSPVIREQAREKRLDPALVAAVIYAESKFDPRASVAGAQGLMQVMPRTAQFLAHRSGATSFTPADLSIPQVNIAYGSYYLRFLLDQYGGSKVLALAAYNGGEANVDHWVAGARARSRRLAIGDIPFPETRAYVEKVLNAQRRYRETYPRELGYRA